MNNGVDDVSLVVNIKNNENCCQTLNKFQLFFFLNTEQKALLYWLGELRWTDFTLYWTNGEPMWLTLGHTYPNFFHFPISQLTQTKCITSIVYPTKSASIQNYLSIQKEKRIISVKIIYAKKQSPTGKRNQTKQLAHELHSNFIFIYSYFNFCPFSSCSLNSYKERWQKIK